MPYWIRWTLTRILGGIIAGLAMSITVHAYCTWLMP